MKKTILTVLTALLFLVSLTGMVSATTLTYNISMDNQFEIFLSTTANEAGTSIGSGDEWEKVSTGSETLNAGQDYYLHVYGYNFNETDSPAGFLGDFSLSDNNYKFENGSQTLVTNTTNWEASTTGWGESPNEPNFEGLNGCDPWGSMDSILNQADWIWAGTPTGESRSDGVNVYPAGDAVYFSTKISQVPIPPSILLLGFGFLGVVGMNRKRTKLS